MCIRDSFNAYSISPGTIEGKVFDKGTTMNMLISEDANHIPCLLYTSDAADERSSVDLGGRRIIKKKNNNIYLGRRNDTERHTTTKHYKIDK